MTSSTADISPAISGVAEHGTTEKDKTNTMRNNHGHRLSKLSTHSEAPNIMAFTSHITPEGRPNGLTANQRSRLSRRPIGPSDIAIYKDYTYWMKIVFSLGVAQLFLEAGIRAALLVEGSMFGSIAYLAHFLIYAAEVPICFTVAPMIYRWFELHTQAKFLSSLGTLFIVIYIYQLAYATNYPENTPANSPWYLVTAILVGIMYPLVEITNYAIIGRCGYFECRDPTRPLTLEHRAQQRDDGEDRYHRHHHHHSNGDDDDDTQHGLLAGVQRCIDFVTIADPSQTTWHDAIGFKKALGKVLSKFFAIYFALFGVSGIMILILGSLVLPNVTVSTTLNEQRMIFCWLLALFPLAAVFIFNMVPPCPRSDVIPGTPPPLVSPLKTMKLVLTHKQLLVIIPSIVAGGMVDAYFYGEFSTFVATPYLGQRVIPFLVGILFFTQGLSSWVYGLLIYKGYLKRRIAILIGAAILTIFFVLRIALFYSNRGIVENFRQDPSTPDKWIKNRDPTPWEFFMIFGLTILLGIGKAAYDSQIPAIVYHHFQLTEYHVIAVCNYKGYRSIGSTLVYGIDLWGVDKIGAIYSDQRVFPTTSVILLVIVVIAYLPSGGYWLKNSLPHRAR